MLKKKFDCLKIINSIEKAPEFKKFIFPHAKLLLAYSGGQDSSTLLTIFFILSKKWNFQLGVVYCNHGWIKTNKPFLTVFQEIQNYKLPFYYVDNFYPRNEKIENIARQWRYKSFQKIQQKGNYHFLLTAHTLTDKIETLLFHLCRGTGLKGINSLKRIGLSNLKQKLNFFCYEKIFFSDFKMSILKNIYFKRFNKTFEFFFAIYILKCYKKKIQKFKKNKTINTSQKSNKKQLKVIKKKLSLITFFNPTIYILIKKLLKILLFLITKKIFFIKNKKKLNFSADSLIKKYFKSRKLNYLIKKICIKNSNKNINYKFHSNIKHIIYTNYVVLDLFYTTLKNHNSNFFYQQSFNLFHSFFTINLNQNFLKRKQFQIFNKKNYNKLNKKQLKYFESQIKHIQENNIQYYIKNQTLISFFFIYYPITIFVLMNNFCFKIFVFNKSLKNLLKKKQSEKLYTILLLKTKIINKNKVKKPYKFSKKFFFNIYFYLFKLQQNKLILFLKKLHYYIYFLSFFFKQQKVFYNIRIKKSKQTLKKNFFLRIPVLKTKYKLKNFIQLKNLYLKLNKKPFFFIKKPLFFYKKKGFFIFVRQYIFKNIFFNCLKNELYEQRIKNQIQLCYKKHLIIIRPLLKINRNNIFLFAKKLNLIIYFDPTNKNLIFTRNYIRYQILPLLKNINPKLEKNIYKFSQIAYFYYKKLKIIISFF